MIIDVYQDTVCPWCRIGAKHLGDAIAQWRGELVTVRYHPFELRPEMPAAGRDYLDHMAAIKGDRNIQPLFDRVCAAGQACDLTFNFDRIGRMPNTLLSHVLLAAAPEERQAELLHAIHSAHFEEGADLGEREVLIEIATGIGIERAPLAAKLDDPAFCAGVAAQAARARALGITGVPFFIFNQVLAVSGAQPASVLLSAMHEASQLAAVS